MPNDKLSYWENRFESVQDRLQAKGTSFYKRAYKENLKAAAALEREIEAFYSRFADNNDISLQEARRILTSDERKMFQIRLEEYIEKGKTLNYSDEWMKELENASTIFRISRLKELQFNMRQLAEEFAAYYNGGATQLVMDIYTDGYYQTIYETQQCFSVGRDFARVDHHYIETLVSKPWTADGRTFSSRIWGNKKEVVRYMDDRIMRGLMTGEDKRTLIKDMGDKFRAQFNSDKEARTAAGRLIMTESAYYSAVATKAGYDSQGVKRFKYIATLDEKTCKICGVLDTKEFDTKDYSPGVNAEPMHSRCRCHTMPLEDDFFKDIFDEVYGKDETRVARSKDGKSYTVPKMSWQEWKEKENI